LTSAVESAVNTASQAFPSTSSSDFEVARLSIYSFMVDYWNNTLVRFVTVGSQVATEIYLDRIATALKVPLTVYYNSLINEINQ
jgi:hypothetical protein